MTEEDYNADEGEDNVYNKRSREELVDNDELTPEEEAFMKGYDEDDGEEKESSEDKDKDKDGEEH
ncbi:MAG: hypothetical protein ABIC95_02905 [archaeon]